MLTIHKHYKIIANSNNAKVKLFKVCKNFIDLMSVNVS